MFSKRFIDIIPKFPEFTEKESSMVRDEVFFCKRWISIRNLIAAVQEISTDIIA